MTVLGGTRLGTVALVLALSAVSAAPGADYEVQQVKGPHVVQHEVGPLMEVSRNNKRHASGCLSCSLHGRGSSYGMGGIGGVVSPQSTSTRQEFRSEQQYVNGQPVYKLEHERRFQDGQLVHDRRVEEDEDDLGVPAGSSSGYRGSQSSLTRSGSTSSGYGQGGYNSQPSYDNRRGSHVSGQSPGSSQYGYTSSNSQDLLASMQEQMRRQMLSQSSHQPTYGGSQRSEQHSESRFINGKPVYKLEKELNYKDGQLVTNRTEEQGPDDLGTEDIVRRYDSTGALISGGSAGYYGSNRQHQQHSTSSSHNTYPGYSSFSNNPSYQSWESWSSYSNGPISGHSSSYQPTSSGSLTRHRQESSRSSSRYPTSGSSSTTYREQSGQHSSSYPTYRPSSGGSSTSYREDSSRHSSSYPTYRPSSGGSSTTYREYSNQPSPSYPTYRPTSSGSSTTYREESSQHSSSYPSHRETPTTEAPDDLDVMPVRHNEIIPSDNRPNTRTYHQNSRSSSSRVSQDNHGRRPSGGHRGSSHTDTSRDEHYRQYDHRRGGEHTGSSSYQPSVGTSSGGARTVAFDLSSSTSPSGSSITDHLLQPNHSGRRHDTSDEDLQQHSDDDYEPQRVGIPGVISGPAASSGQPNDHDSDDDEDDDEQRYDISPLDDGITPTIPSVDNELESGPISIPSSDRDVIGSTEVHDFESSDHLNTHRTQHRRPFSSGSFTTTYRHSNTHSQEDDRVTGHVSPSDRDQHYSQTLSRDESRNTRPVVGSSSYNYNETNIHTSSAGGHQPQTLPGQLPSTSCSQAGGCVISVMPQSISRRTEIRTTRRYVNGHLIGITMHERQYENGTLVHENSTEYGRDELEGLDLDNVGSVQMDLTQGTYQPSSYSQQHEVQTEKKFINGHQVYEANHERRFEDGSLVYENHTEKDEDDFPDEGHGTINLGLGTLNGDAGQQVIQMQEHHRQVASGRGVSGGVSRSSQDHLVTDTSRVVGVPKYTSRRYESRREQEYVDGQPVYDLHEERRFHDGSLVHENRTELTEEELANGGYRDALHDILAGRTQTTATQLTNSGSDRQNYGSYGGAVDSSHSSGSHIQSGASYDQSSQTHGSYGQTHGSYGQTPGSYGQTHGGQDGSHGLGNSESGSFTTSILSSGRQDSGRATTTVLGGSGSLLTGSDSLRSASSSDEDNSRESTSLYESHGSTFQGRESRPTSHGHNVDSVERRVLQGSSSSSRDHGSYGASDSFSGSTMNSGSHGSGRATTTVLGGLGSSGSTSSQYGGGSRGAASSYESHSSSSQTRGSGGSGCLSCVLMGGSGRTQGSHDFSGSDLSGGGGYSHRREMNVEEHYEDGELVRGRHDSREFEDGQLVHENTRHYSDGSETQISGSSLGSRGSSHSSRGAGPEVCQTNPCQNGGTCLPGVYSAICTCHFGFRGRTCEEVECPRGYCRRGGTCSVEDGRHVCTCTSGYEGPRCQRRSSRRSRRHASRP